MADAPDQKHVAREVDAQFPYLLQTNTSAANGEFLQRLLDRLNGGVTGQSAEWRHIHKDGGENGVHLPPPINEKVSVDVIWHAGTRRQIDVINGAHNAPIPGGVAWNEIDPAVYRPGNVPVGPWAVAPVIPPTGVTKHIAKLGFGWFCMSRAFSPERGWPSDARASLAFIREHMPALKYWRWFADVEGIRHAVNGVDPWELAGTNVFGAYWPDEARRLIDIVGERGEQLHVTMWGGTGHASTLDDWRRGHDRFCSVFRDAWAVVEAIEGVNEYNINGFSEADVRAIVRDLRLKVPSTVKLACSSPALAHGLVEVGGAWYEPTNEQMGESIDALYAGLGDAVHEMTVHVSRGSEKWGDPFSYNPYQPTLGKRMNEPRGPGASAGGDISDPNQLARDYQHTCDARWTHYTGHSRWSVWNGRIPAQWKDTGRWPEDNVWDHPTLGTTFGLWNQIAGGGDPNVPPRGPTPGPSVGDQYLRANEQMFLTTIVRSWDRRFEFKYQPDGNLILDKVGHGHIWASNTAGTTVGSVNMNPDGNMVVYDKNGNPVWASGTNSPGASLSIQDDGNGVIYDTAGTPLWATNTAGA